MENTKSSAVHVKFKVNYKFIISIYAILPFLIARKIRFRYLHGVKT